MRKRLENWMDETDDRIRHGPVPAPPGADYNQPDQRSPNDPPREARLAGPAPLSA
jgi:hypothetical protein